MIFFYEKRTGKKCGVSGQTGVSRGGDWNLAGLVLIVVDVQVVALGHNESISHEPGCLISQAGILWTWRKSKKVCPGFTLNFLNRKVNRGYTCLLGWKPQTWLFSFCNLLLLTLSLQRMLRKSK